MKTHIKARLEAPDAYPPRSVGGEDGGPVPEDRVPWSTDLPGYDPPYFVAQRVLDNDRTKTPGGWADPEDVGRVTRDIVSFEGSIRRDADGRPLNACGRTGIAGRGLLGKWGPNVAADPILTRPGSGGGPLEMLAIRRRDNGLWAIPGGMVDDGEEIAATLKRELEEETGVRVDLNDAIEVHRGYVDDPRNTDHAWMESVVVVKHLDAAAAAALEARAGDDAVDVRWMPITEQTLAAMHASHGSIVRRAVEVLRGRGVVVMRSSDRVVSGKPC
ncbi:MAG: NUDIX domain-containing protein [Myxococcota bacterium]